MNWGGLAVYARGRPLSWLTGALRAEIYADPDGFTTGRSQLLAEVTGTLDATIPFGRGALVARLEYRHDQSNAPVFDTGIPAIRTFQDTLTLALVVGQ